MTTITEAAPKDAVFCGIGYQVSCDQLNMEIVSENRIEMVVIGVGIHHAVVSCGMLGDETRLSCTLVSSQVNLASRLEGLTRFYGARIIVSKEAFIRCGDDATKDIMHRSLGHVQVKGQTKKKGTAIMEVYQADNLSLKLYKQETAQQWDQAIRHQEKGAFKEALEEFKSIHDIMTKREVKDEALICKIKMQEHQSRVDIFNEK